MPIKLSNKMKAELDRRTEFHPLNEEEKSSLHDKGGLTITQDKYFELQDFFRAVQEKKLWDEIYRLREEVQVQEAHLEAELKEKKRRRPRTKAYIMSLRELLREAELRVKRLVADREHTEEALHEKQERFDGIKEERNEALRKVSQREKFITALLMPWMAILGPLYLRTQLEEFMEAVFLKADPQTYYEIQLLMNYEMKELLNHGRTFGEVRDDEDELEVIKKVTRKFLHSVEAVFPENH